MIERVRLGQSSLQVPKLCIGTMTFGFQSSEPTAFRILDRVAEEVAHLGRVEVMPKQDGRNMTMVLGPDKKAQAAAAKKAAEAEAAEAAEGDTLVEERPAEVASPDGQG